MPAPSLSLSQLLGVSRSAEGAEIKKAYRKAALIYHPDRQSSKSEEEKEKAGKVFRDIAEAYEVRGGRWGEFGFWRASGWVGFMVGVGFEWWVECFGFLSIYIGGFGGVLTVE